MGVDGKTGTDDHTIDKGIHRSCGCQTCRDFVSTSLFSFKSDDDPLEPDHGESASHKATYYSRQCANAFHFRNDVGCYGSQNRSRSEMLDRASYLRSGTPEQGNHAANDSPTGGKQDIG